MNFCPHCGQPVEQAGTAFCAFCGQRLDTPAAPAVAAPVPAATPAGEARRVIPPPPQDTPTSGSTGSGAPLPQVDWNALLGKLLIGNWLGSAFVAAATVLVAGVLATGLGLLIKPDGFGVANTLTLITLLMAGAFGADLVGDTSGEELTGDGSLGVFPLTITIVTLAVTVVLFRRLTARYGDVRPALGDAVRIAVMTALPLTLAALVFRTDNEALGRRLRDLEAESADELISVGVSVSGAFFMPILVVTTVLAIACLTREHWWPGRSARVAAWVSGAVRGVTAMIVALPLCGVVAVASVVLIGDGVEFENLGPDEWGMLIGTGVACLANLGFVFTVLGSGAEVGADYTAQLGQGSDGFSDTMSEVHRLAYYAGDGGDEPGLWIALAVLPIWLLIGAYFAARRAPSRAVVPRTLLVWSATLLVAVPLLNRIASVRGGASFETRGEEVFDFGEGSYTAFVGPDVLQATAFVVLLSLLAVVVVAVLAGALDLRAVSQRAAEAARDLQVAGPTAADHGTSPKPQSPVQSPTDPSTYAPPASPPPPVSEPRPGADGHGRPGQPG